MSLQEFPSQSSWDELERHQSRERRTLLTAAHLAYSSDGESMTVVVGIDAESGEGAERLTNCGMG